MIKPVSHFCGEFAASEGQVFSPFHGFTFLQGHINLLHIRDEDYQLFREKKISFE